MSEVKQRRKGKQEDTTKKQPKKEIKDKNVQDTKKEKTETKKETPPTKQAPRPKQSSCCGCFCLLRCCCCCMPGIFLLLLLIPIGYGFAYIFFLMPVRNYTGTKNPTGLSDYLVTPIGGEDFFEEVTLHSEGLTFPALKAWGRKKSEAELDDEAARLEEAKKAGKPAEWANRPVPEYRQTNFSTVVFLHGFPDNYHSFIHQQRALSAHGITSYSVALRGYDPGCIPKNMSDIGIQQSVRDLFNFLDELKVGRVQLIGHDWGAVIGYLAAIQQPHRIRSLVLMAIPPPRRFQQSLEAVPRQLLHSWYMFFFQIPVLPELWLTKFDGVRKLWSTWGIQPFSEERLANVEKTLSKTGVARAAIQYYRDTVPASLNDMYQKLVVDPRHVTKWDQLIEPTTMIIAGSEDQCILVDFFEAGIEDSDFQQEVTTRGVDAGHFMQHENPERLSTLIRAWLVHPTH
eukprot:TRINITY_DN67904_c6_g1_i1.p1 TRINITY_DN67904_c6_g1~~TRINITY_DN67904_c6_g1_i1.p1  ORF type:complete len:457 (-),score=26.99 TRINITY_DN67904_c6_g1_i1:159-1529(-)